MPEFPEFVVGLFFLGAIVASAIAGVVFFASAVRKGRECGIRVPWVLFPMVVAVLGTLYWQFLRLPLGDRMPVFRAASLLRSLVGLVVITTPPCLIWMSPAVFALLWIAAARRLRSP